MDSSLNEGSSSSIPRPRDSKLEEESSPKRLKTSEGDVETPMDVEAPMDVEDEEEDEEDDSYLYNMEPLEPPPPPKYWTVEEFIAEFEQLNKELDQPSDSSHKHSDSPPSPDPDARIYCPFTQVWIDPVQVRKDNNKKNKIIDSNYETYKKNLEAIQEQVDFSLLRDTNMDPYQRVVFPYMDFGNGRPTRLEHDIQLCHLYHKIEEGTIEIKIHPDPLINATNTTVVEEFVNQQKDQLFSWILFDDILECVMTFEAQEIYKKKRTEAEQMLDYLIEGKFEADISNELKFRERLSEMFPFIMTERNGWLSMAMIDLIKNAKDKDKAFYKEWIEEHAAKEIDDNYFPYKVINQIEYMKEKLDRACRIGVIERLPWRPFDVPQFPSE